MDYTHWTIVVGACLLALAAFAKGVLYVEAVVKFWLFKVPLVAGLLLCLIGMFILMHRNNQLVKL